MGAFVVRVVSENDGIWMVVGHAFLLEKEWDFNGVFSRRIFSYSFAIISVLLNGCLTLFLSITCR